VLRGGYRGYLRRFHKKLLNCPFVAGLFLFWSSFMDRKPSDLAGRMSVHRESTTGLKFKLPLELARAKVRGFLNETPLGGYTTIVEHWCQLPDGQIEFTVRRLRTAD
jgi:hypothetical protein